MAGYYLDTSALIKRYHIESGTEEINKILSETDGTYFISRLAGIEMRSAFARQVRMQHVAEADLVLIHQRFLSDLTDKRFHVIRMLSRHFVMAEHLIEKYGRKHGLRTLDALQLAVAVDIRNIQAIDSFVCADDNLCSVAELEQFEVFNPVKLSASEESEKEGGS